MALRLQVDLGSGNILDCHFCEACGNSQFQMVCRCIGLSGYVEVGWYFSEFVWMLHFVALGLI